MKSLLGAKPPIQDPKGIRPSDRRELALQQLDNRFTAVHDNVRDEWGRHQNCEEARALLTLSALLSHTLRAADGLVHSPARGIDDLRQAISELTTLLQRTDVPPALRPFLGYLYVACLDAEALLETPVTNPPPTFVAEVTNPNALIADQRTSPVIEINSSVLYQLRKMLLPAERMAIGAVRRKGMTYQVEAIVEVSEERHDRTHVNADPKKMAKAIFDVITPSGTFFGLWAHSQPGRGPLATCPSQEDLDNYAARRENGDSEHLLGLIVVEDCFRFFGTSTPVDVIGEGIRRITDSKGGELYAFSH